MSDRHADETGEVTFEARIADAFILTGRGLVLQLTDVSGEPRVGDIVTAGSHTMRITALGRNSTDGKPISTRSCLTGQTVAPYGFVLTDWVGHSTPGGIVGLTATGRGISACSIAS